MTRIMQFLGGKKQETKKEIELKEAIAFWQKEVHYYEGRAGSQGDSASRLVTVAAGATAVLPIISNALNANSSPAPDSRLLLVLPVLLFLLWSTATRLLHEMQMLRVYVQKAEFELQKLTTDQPTLKSYVRWAEHGGKHDYSYYVTLVFGVAVFSLSVAGAFGVSFLVVQKLYPDMVTLAFAVLAPALIVLLYAFANTAAEQRALQRELGLPVEPSKIPQVPQPLKVAGLIAAGLTTILWGPIVWLVVNNPTLKPWAPAAAVLAFAGVLALLSAYAGVMASVTPKNSPGRIASMVLAAASIGGGLLFVIGAAIWGWLR